jgi:putative lipoic acid-binding regulatory protein
MASTRKSQPGDLAPPVEYPVAYEFKVMGLREEGFGEFVRGLFVGVLGRVLAEDAISEHFSAQGKYVSLRISVTLSSEAHRVAIYEALHREERIVYYL